jgi:oligoribonuclease (3'-5' exoribonuclease)/arginyl-tRNA--protein-N-Asp/Glu arginylyltransferase
VASFRQVGGDPPEWLVHDEPTRCVYLPGETAHLPLRLPTRRLNAAQFARRLEAGDRRQGVLLYRPSCRACRACQPLRLDVARFVPNRTQRRIYRRGEQRLSTHVGRPTVTPEKVALYNRHKIARGLLVSGELLDAGGYEEFLVESCTDSIEIDYRLDGQLIAVAIADRAANALSAVYCYFDPSASVMSPGAYSILKQIALCRQWGLRHLYLGLYVVGCAAMAYKVGYLPHERLIDGAWVRFERYGSGLRHTNMPAQSDQHLVWMDLEMTGLDPDRDTILEIATLITGPSLEVVAEGPVLAIGHPRGVLEAMDEWNRTHHGASGLIERVLASPLGMRDAEDQTLAFVKQYCAQRVSPLCGNSVYQDRRFLARYMPELEGYLHYRNIDVSTVKELVRRWYPDGPTPPEKRHAHLALDDIRESIAELRFYRRHYFRR